MSTHKICFCGEIRYQHFSDEKNALSVAMLTDWQFSDSLALPKASSSQPYYVE